MKIPGSYVGLPTSRAGGSHNCIEDIAVMRALPNMRVADPGDNADLRAIMRAAVEVRRPGLLPRHALDPARPLWSRTTASNGAKGSSCEPGRDVTLFGTGMMTALCLQAADLLAGEWIDAEVVHLASIKPIDSDLIDDFGRPHRLRRDRRECLHPGRVRLRRRRGAWRTLPGARAQDRGARPLGG